ncbi:MAG: GGDEF domain-containing protein [Candidatus Acidiferrales bacterium]
MTTPLNFTDFLEHRSKRFLALFGFVLFAAVVLVDRVTGWEITSSILYLLPVSYFAWYFSSGIGSVVALLSVFAWLLLNRLKGPQYSGTFIPYWNGLISLALYLILVFILGEVKAIYRRERENSRVDFLTGMINQRGFYEALRKERERASRLDTPTSLAYIDLDNFKLVNDRFDHQTGDNVLASVGHTLRDSIRNIDLAGRLGGDEFCVLLPNTDAAGARVIIEKLKEALSDVMKTSDWYVTFSIGAVTFLRPAKSADEMIRAADRVMYSAKTQGKNRIVYAVEP